jgi:hypothetical protein
MYLKDFNLSHILGLDPDEERVLEDMVEGPAQKIYTDASNNFLNELDETSDSTLASINVGTIGVIDALAFLATARDLYRAGKEYGRS